MHALILDDEINPANHLKALLKKYCPEVTSITILTNPVEALLYLKKESTQLLFLDIEMPEMNGFEFIEIVGVENLPGVIFTTAHSKYAVQAFRVNPIDFLLKPVDENELVEAVSRVTSTEVNDLESKLESLLNHFPEPFHKRIPLTEGQSYHFVEIDQIIRVKASGSYSEFYLKEGRKILTSRRLKYYADRLEKRGFIRTHNSHLVNVQCVKTFIRSNGGELELEGGHFVPVSLRMKDHVKRKLRLLE
ncbi:response regulator transcription factor [bacterium SCSIO 12741]|nr:response regulator transcription factor [bacterium SCSIO 12741]